MSAEDIALRALVGSVVLVGIPWAVGCCIDQGAGGDRGRLAGPAVLRWGAGILSIAFVAGVVFVVGGTILLLGDVIVRTWR